MKDMSITEKLNMQFYRCNKLLKRSAFEQRMENLKTTPFKGQGRILRILLENGEMSQKDIVLDMDIRPSTASELIEKLEKAGLVEKIPNPDDKRGTIIKLTEQGKKEALSSKWDLSKITDEMFSALTSTEQVELSRMLDKLIESFKKYERDEFSKLGKKLKSEYKESKEFFKTFFKDIGGKLKKSDDGDDEDGDFSFEYDENAENVEEVKIEIVNKDDQTQE